MAGYGLLVIGPSLHFWFGFVSKLLPERDLVTTFKKILMGQTIYEPIMTVVFFSLNARLQGSLLSSKLLSILLIRSGFALLTFSPGVLFLAALGEQLVFISIGCLHDIHGKSRETSATPPADGLNTYHFILSTKLCLLTTQPCTVKFQKWDYYVKQKVSDLPGSNRIQYSAIHNRFDTKSPVFQIANVRMR
ncbi:hypothetical protein DKX38_025014 [Salix brachista]|uniref:Uncharacterized protein n=1 Tax=Salix brachista TaxID=2182728 RepID=A0A5N5JU58_9ROSI|nr:hypothetical protein DKX38_025014 [Salix brachista]